MKNILVVFTGGTIGSSVCNGEINTDTQTHFLLLSQFKMRNPHAKIHFTTLQPYEILSENLTPETWTTLIQSIENANPNAYDGIIITHGTDTLAYTSSAIHLYFHALSVPIFLVSSQYPLSDERANGLDNFSYAVNKILEGNLRGVFVPYRNTHSQDITLHYGTHLTCSPELSSDFFSVTPHHKIEHTVKALKKLKPNFSTRILIIKPYPGINYDNFNLDNVDVILHDLYHSGTACTTPEYGHNYSLVYFIRRCKALNIPVFLAPAFKSTQFYQSTIELNYEGAEIIWNTSIEAAYAKLLLAYGNFEHYEDILIFLNDNVAGEQI
mgnify:CR=1 FL=1